MIPIKDVIFSRAFQVTAGIVASASISAALSHVITKQRLEAEFETRLAREIEDTKKFYSALHKKGDFATPQAAVSTLITQRSSDDPRPPIPNLVAYNAVRALETYQGTEEKTETSTEDEEDDEPVVNNVFDKSRTRDLSEDEIKERDLEQVYIISFEEYVEGTGQDQSPHEQITLTYYAEDDVLADDKDMPVDDVEYLVRNKNLNKFGVGSNDPRALYVRNESVATDFEIIFHDGSYAEIVHGIQPDETTRKTRKPRGDYE